MKIIDITISKPPRYQRNCNTYWNALIVLVFCLDNSSCLFGSCACELSGQACNDAQHCGYHGIIVGRDSNNSCLCRCEAEWEGADCGTYKQIRCNSYNDCNGHGTTTDDNNTDGCICRCDSGFVEPDCQPAKLRCYASPDCFGHGTTTDEDYRDGCDCQCMDGYSGGSCEIELDTLLVHGNPCSGVNCASLAACPPRYTVNGCFAPSGEADGLSTDGLSCIAYSGPAVVANCTKTSIGESISMVHSDSQFSTLATIEVRCRTDGFLALVQCLCQPMPGSGSCGNFSSLVPDGDVCRYQAAPGHAGAVKIVALCRTAAFEPEVVVWGNFGRDGFLVGQRIQSELFAVQHLVPLHGAFAATRADGRLVCWAHSWDEDVTATAVESQLWSIEETASLTGDSTNFGQIAFAARRADGSVATWGPALAGDSRAVRQQLVQVERLYSNDYAFVAKKRSGEVIAWGDPWVLDVGGETGAAQEQLFSVDMVVSTTSAFAVLRADGIVVPWGGGDTSRIKEELLCIREIFAAREREAVCRWGVFLAV